MNGSRIFFVDDEEHLRIAAGQTFELADMDIECFDSAAKALRRLGRDFDGVLVTDIRMPGMDGIELLTKALAIDPELPVVLVTGHGDVDLAVASIRGGAFDFIEKPWNPERLVTCVRHAADHRRLTLENRSLRTQVVTGTALDRRLYGRSAAMEALRRSVAAVAATDVDALVTGETGTGKEVVARLLHGQSARRTGPFVHINCAALPEALIESELFGHEPGAFPGATRVRFGKFEHARRGTLCLDEIDLLPMPLQAKLLDVLHNRTLTRLGSNDPVDLDMRVVALSKTDLAQAVEAGRFRMDLFYRLNVASLALPPIARRREDIPGLFMLLAARIANETGRALPEVPNSLLASLARRDWPGNVREIRNVAERFVLGLSEAMADDLEVHETLADRVAAYEKAQISAVIAANGGNLRASYESLGLSRKALYDKMQKHGLHRSDFRDDG